MTHLNSLESDGFSIVNGVYSPTEITRLMTTIDTALSKDQQGIKSSLGETYAARNLAKLAPSLAVDWQKPQLMDLLRQTLGPEFGLVRILYFDKHPNRTWSLPWHKDMTIAVRDNSLPTTHFAKPTRKSGVDHVEASTEVLQRMLTLRIHLDKVTLDNGPLEVARGSHLHGKKGDDRMDVVKVLVDAGDVLAMRPLLSHTSGSSTPGTSLHRRILHLEFAASRELPDGYQWHQFLSPT